MAIDSKILEELKNQLLVEKNKTENELSLFAKPTNIPGEYETQFEDIGTDVDENASEVEEYTDKLALENDLERRLRDVNDALKRIDDGIYGVCSNCNQEIDIERLRAYPAARTCIKCK